jgi:hypothetical protein
MDIDSMTPDALRRALRDALRDNEALRRRLSDDEGDTETFRLSPFAVVVGHMLDGLTPSERNLVGSLGEAMR